MLPTFVLSVIILAFVFDFINGFHDAANSIATIVSTGVLRPIWAVLWAAFFNFIAFLFFHLSVATTVGSGLISPAVVDPYLIFSALSAAIFWNLLTWYFGLPSSSSHALIGGLVGAAFARGGIHVLEAYGLTKVGAAIILSPILGMIVAFFLAWLFGKLTSHWTDLKRHRIFGFGQFISAAALSLTHGGNDAQKTMGVIAVLLFSAGALNGHFYVPFWVVVSCNFVMGLGTLVGGWRIVHTLGKKITPLNTLRGCSAEGGAASVLFVATVLGIPVSTTHTITGAIAGVGIQNRLASTQWTVLTKIVWAWVLTLPATALIAAGFIFIQHHIHLIKNIT